MSVDRADPPYMQNTQAAFGGFAPKYVFFFFFFLSLARGYENMNDAVCCHPLYVKICEIM